VPLESIKSSKGKRKKDSGGGEDEKPAKKPAKGRTQAGRSGAQPRNVAGGRPQHLMPLRTAREKPAPAPKADAGDAAGGSGGKAAPAKARGKKAAKGEAAEAGGAKPKKERKKKDPNAPKGALSAFMYFSNANRSKVKAENPNIAFGEVGKRLGELWKEATPEDKVPYEEMAAKDKKRYVEAMKVFKAGASGAAAAKADDMDDFIGDDEEEEE
ncbi:Non-histone chromosomal protein 6, partial [Tetrabaena socialis]